MGRVALPGASTAWFSSLADTAIAAAMQAALADGTLTFAEASKLVKDVATRGALTAAELASLQSIVANLNLSFDADDYAASALSHFLSGGSANLYWNGGSSVAVPLGDPVVGMSASLLGELYGKWFLGTDLPDPTLVSNGVSTSYSYGNFGMYPLFSAAGPSAADVNQGQDGTCVVLSTSLLMLQNHPDWLRAMLRDNGDGTYGVRFYIRGSEYWVTVNSQLPVKSSGSLVDAHLSPTAAAALWPELIEKAYAQASASGLLGHPAVNGYENISGNQETNVLKAFTNATATRYYYGTDAHWLDEKAVIIAALQNGDDVLLGTGAASSNETYDANHNILLTYDHVFAVERYDAATGNFVVRNPWGQRTNQNWVTEFEVSMADIQGVQGNVCIDNTARTPVRISEIQSISNGASWPWADVVAGAANRVAPLFTAVDSNGKDIQQYAFQAIGADRINLNGATNLATAAQQAQGLVVVSAADLSKITFTPGDTSGTTTLMVKAWDGTDWSPMSRLMLSVQSKAVLTAPVGHVLTPGDVLPITQVVAFDPSVNLKTAWFSFIADPGVIQLNGAVNQWTTNPPVGGIYVNATDFAKLTVKVPASGIFQIQAQAYVNSAWSAWTDVVTQVGDTVSQAIRNFDSGQGDGSHAIADSAAHVFASLDGLQQMVAAGALDAIAVSDRPAGAIALAEKQWVSDLGALSVMSGSFSLNVGALTAAEAAAMPAGASAHVASVTVADTGANVAARLDALHTLTASGKLSQVTVQGGVFTLSESQLQNDADVLGKLAGATRIVATMTGAHTQYAFAQGAGGMTVSGNGHTESLAHVDRLQFTDGWVAFDIGGDSGKAYRLYQAAFDRVPDTAGLGFNTHSLDVGLTLEQVAQQFITSSEFQQKYGNLDNAGWVTMLYNNVLHRGPEQAGYDFHMWELSVGLTRAAQLAEFSESAENQANVIGQIQNGMFYTV